MQLLFFRLAFKALDKCGPTLSPELILSNVKLDGYQNYLCVFFIFKQ